MSNTVFHDLTYGRPINTTEVGAISDLRQIDLNLIYTIKEIILPINGYVTRFSETLTPQGQTVDPITGLPVTYYKANHRDFVYYNPDPTNPALTGLLTTPIISQSGNLAYVNYLNGIVAYSGIQANNIDITYDAYTVFVQDGFPDIGEDPYEIETLQIPLISIDYERRRNTPLALGGKYQEDRTFLINITANSDPQRDDLIDILEDSLKYDYPLTIDYRYGFPIDFNGDKNPNFDRTRRWNVIRFKDAYSRILRVPTQYDKLRHQGLLFVTIRTN